jgi:hypothetical protein
VAATSLAAQQKLTGNLIPQISAGAGVLTMTFHQINADGAGPISCSISTDATGKTFTAITVSTNVPGTNGKSTAANEDFPLIADIPAGTACTGTVGALENVCAVKCANQVFSLPQHPKKSFFSSYYLKKLLNKMLTTGPSRLALLAGQCSFNRLLRRSEILLEAALLPEPRPPCHRHTRERQLWKAVRWRVSMWRRQSYKLVCNS